MAAAAGPQRLHFWPLIIMAVTFCSVWPGTGLAFCPARTLNWLHCSLEWTMGPHVALTHKRVREEMIVKLKSRSYTDNSVGVLW